jgi:hypothetical protein
LCSPDVPKILLLKDKTPSEQSETHMQTRGLKKLPIEMKVVGTK